MMLKIQQILIKSVTYQLLKKWQTQKFLKKENLWNPKNKWSEWQNIIDKLV